MKLVTVGIHFLSAVFGLFSTLSWQRDVTTSPLYEASQFNVNYRLSLSVTSNEGLATPLQMSVSLSEKVYQIAKGGSLSQPKKQRIHFNLCHFYVTDRSDTLSACFLVAYLKFLLCLANLQLCLLLR